MRPPHAIRLRSPSHSWTAAGLGRDEGRLNPNTATACPKSLQKQRCSTERSTSCLNPQGSLRTHSRVPQSPCLSLTAQCQQPGVRDRRLAQVEHLQHGEVLGQEPQPRVAKLRGTSTAGSHQAPTPRARTPGLENGVGNGVWPSPQSHAPIAQHHRQWQQGKQRVFSLSHRQGTEKLSDLCALNHRPSLN